MLASLTARSLSPRTRRTNTVKNVQRTAKADAKLGIYLLSLVLLVIVLGYWLVIAGRPNV
jgi:hypothetical protein